MDANISKVVHSIRVVTRGVCVENMETAGVDEIKYTKHIMTAKKYIFHETCCIANLSSSGGLCAAELQ